MGCIVKQEDDLLPLYYYGYLSLLNVDVKKWNLEKRPGTHQSIGGCTPPSTWRQGHLDLQSLPFRGAKVTMGAGAVFWDVPILGIPCGSAHPVHNGSKLRM
jgi:hypothetical protein